MFRKIFAVIIVAAMLCVSLSTVSFSSSGEDVTGPFADKNDGYPLTSDFWDQEMTTLDGPSGPFGQSYVYAFGAQSFRPGMTGTLKHVGMYLDSISGTGNFYWDVREGMPTGGSIMGGSQSRPISGLTSGTWNFMNLPLEITVDAGVLYYIILSADSGSEFYWASADPGTYADGQPYTSQDDSAWNLYNLGTPDFSFRTYMSVPSGGIKKVAWHSNGEYALGVTGEVGGEVWRFDREDGSWSLFNTLDSQDRMNDICYDEFHGQFYLVGGRGSNAFAWIYQPGGVEWLSLPSPSNDVMFNGVEKCYGYSDYYFIAVGHDYLAGTAYAAWYSSGAGWEELGGFSVNDETLYDVTWDYENVGSYYMVGTDDDDGSGALYVANNPGDTGVSEYDTTGLGDSGFMAIDWCPDYMTYDYGIIVGYGINAAAWKLQGITLTPLLPGYTGTLEDVDWFPDGSEAVAVGSEGSIFRYMPASGRMNDATGVAKYGANDLNGIALKGPSSPSSGIIVGTNGAIGFYPCALDQSTTITTKVVNPQLRWIGFNDTMMNQQTGQVDVDTFYFFTLFGNYSEGWDNCRVDVEAWFDNGIAGSLSNYPAETNATRNLAFKLSYIVASGNYSCNTPNNGTEITIGGVNDTNMNDNVPGQENHTLGLELRFGSQIRAADGDGFPVPPGYSKNKDFGLVNNNTWDFCIRLSDANTYPVGGVNHSYGEFGIKEKVSISVSGNPYGSGSPGASGIPLTSSFIEYSSNTDYRVNVSIPDLYLGGNTSSPYSISAGSLSVQNFGSLADVSNSEIWNAETPIPGTEAPITVWGTDAVPVPPIGNGTTSNGPYISNFNNGSMGFSTFTEVKWWINISAGIPEGAYWATICISIDDF